MTITRELAERYGLVTADQLPPRPKPVEDHGRLRARWSHQKKAAFRTLGPHALCVVATDGPVSVTVFDGERATRRFGHNRGCWPVRIATSGSWDDTVTATYNRSPFVWTGVQIRLWTPSDAHAKSLALGVGDLLQTMAEETMGAQLINGYVDLGPDLDFAMLEMQIAALAERLRIAIWDDDGLSRHLDQVVARDLGRQTR